MHGPTCTFWANLTPLSLETSSPAAAAAADAGKFDVSGLEEGDYRVEAVVLQSRAGGAIRGSAKIQAGDRDAELRFVE